MSGRILKIAKMESPDTPVKCRSCDWLCLASEVKPMTEGVLQPGDTVPAGLCPQCGGDSLPIRAPDRIRECAREFAAVAAQMIYGEGTDHSLQRVIDLSLSSLASAAITRDVAEKLALIPTPPSKA